ncbi:uncharacterized protein Tco025E_09478 [Trypanosoma conorhini]|uniref:Uncharacterized protein n=1 Tax=Trypanosoma conorhini TaxID=83891 RepID=A0A422MVZ1_9TRYP|nr:uncharacterized protein Tco025E_09478 [Trypanosoma conorhini]RNE97356.1 hypothetical protein Tco025E_09478 [Trypanosoma conorhini]
MIACWRPQREITRGHWRCDCISASPTMRCPDEEEVTATCARRTRAIIPRRSKRSSGRRSRVARSLSDRCRVASSVRLRSVGAPQRVTAPGRRLTPRLPKTTVLGKARNCGVLGIRFGCL